MHQKKSWWILVVWVGIVVKFVIVEWVVIKKSW